MKSKNLLFAFILIFFNLALCNAQIINEKGISYTTVVHDTLKKTMKNNSSSPNTVTLFLGPTFDKSSVEIYVNNKLFDKRTIKINKSVDVATETIPNIKNVRTIGISINNSNIATFTIKPKAYWITIDIEKTKKTLQIYFLNSAPMYD